MDIDKAQLANIWEEATTLADAHSSPLATAIINEALEGGGNGEVANAKAAADAVFRIATDCEDFAEAIVRAAQPS